MTGALNMGAQAITNCGDVTSDNANGFLLENAAASATNPTLCPNRSTPTYGIGSQASSVEIVQAGAQGGNFGSTGLQQVTGGLAARGLSSNGGIFQALVSATTQVTGMSGATVTATSLIPAGSIVYGVVCRVTTAITGATTFQVGDGTTANLWGNTIAISLGTTSSPANFLSTFTPKLYTAANNVVLTANGSNFTAGAVRILVYYYTMTAPTA